MILARPATSWRRLWLICCVLLCAASVLPLAVPALAQPQSATLFIEGATATAGETFATDLVLVSGRTQAVDSFEVELQYDPLLVKPVGARVAAGWDETPAGTPDAPARVRLSAHAASAGGCSGVGSCQLAVFEWESVAAGDGAIGIAFADLYAADARIEGISSAPGTVSIAASQAANSNPVGSPLGPGNTLAVVVIFVLVGLALALPLMAAARRHRKRAQPRATGAAPSIAPNLRGDLAAAVGVYLSQYEIAGEVLDAPDILDEQLAKETAFTGQARSGPVAGD